MTSSPKRCFVIGPIGEDGSDVRKSADDFYELLLVETLQEAGFEPERADHITTPGQITKDIVDRLVSADVVVADLREPNPNVYYELSFRNAQRKAVIPFKKVGQVLPFDIKDSRTISVDVADTRSAHDAKRKLKKYLADLPVPGTAASVWSVSLDALKLEKGSPMDQTIARILATTELLPSMHRRIMDGDEINVSLTARTMWELIAGTLEEFIDDPLWVHDANTLKCLEHVRKLERVILDFVHAPYIDESVVYR